MNKYRILISLYSASSGIFINMIGRLMLAELIAVVMLPTIKISKLLQYYKELKVILIGLLILLLAQVTSDIINHTPSTNYIRGWAAIVFSMVSIIFLTANLAKDSKNIIFYLFVLMLAKLILGEGALDLGILNENSNYFKVRFIPFLNPAVMLLGYYFYSRNKTNIAGLSFILFGLICLVLDARSNGLIFLISGLLLYIKSFRIRIDGLQMIISSIVLSLLLYASFVFYVDQVLNGKIGGKNSVTQLEKSLNPYNPFELLYFGRSEFIILMHAGMDKPLLGHGSWGEDPNGKYALLRARLMDEERVAFTNYIVAHSIVFGYFAYAGIFGLLTIIFIYYKIFSYALKIYKATCFVATLPIIIVLSIDMIWSFLFSPIGAIRTALPIFASIVIVEYMNVKMFNQANELRKKNEND